MNRIIILLLIAVSIFSTLIYINVNYILVDEEPQEVQQKEEPKASVLVTQKAIKRSQPLTPNFYDKKFVHISDLDGSYYTLEDDLIVEPGALFKEDIAEGTYLTQDMISNPGDRDYMYLSLNDGELPYFYEVTGIGVVQTATLTPGDKVSFVSTTSSKSNLVENGYGDIGDLVSRVIISGARVLHVIKGSEETDSEDAEDKKYSLVIALNMRSVLKLEMAQKIGDVNIIPSEIENRYLSIRSSDLLETQFGVRELRGKE
ncbi:CpaB family protein [Vibrio kanaloae]|uniref:pilus assembly protein CpaB n=1 Tax=Vibrio kanaloae TaxID=170673 RepID=UPI0012447661|nr:pilus assembly protein CpaB [Vibrio kanaloae]KAB0465446.1 pilus assembly protein CpaB [Vibrio kanaloae]UIJ42269.1 pilus assembly protein CpaB [Vibrio kanaloae]